MQYVRYCVSWLLPTRASRYALNWHALRALVSGLMLSPLFVPDHAFGQAKTIELSPVLARSTLLGPVDQHQQISVLLALPLSDPQGKPLVTCVGGTTLTTGPNEAWLGEEVWNRLALGDGATGGGVSSFWTIPDWQVRGYVTNNGGSSIYRNVPDVGAVADPLTGVGVYSKINGGWIQIGGTSLSAPIWGGYMSILNAGSQYLYGTSIGFFNPTLYNIGYLLGIGYGNPSNYLFPAPDGTNGNPGLYGGTAGFSAGYGYDNCTGSGTIWGGYFAAQVLTAHKGGGKAPAGFVFFIPTLTTTTAEFSWTDADLADGYVVELEGPGYIANDYTGFVTKKRKLTITNLTPKTGYILNVYAVNKHGATQETFDFITK